MTDSVPVKFKPNKWWYLGGAAAIGAYVFYRRRQSQNAPAQTANTPTADPSIDPATGIPYADETTSDPYGYGQGYSLAGYQDPGTGAYITGAGASGPAGNTVLAASTNAEWSQQVESYLVNQGYDAASVGAALGHYLHGNALTSDEATIVETGMAYFGSPPQGAPGLHLQPPAGQTGTTPATYTPLPAPKISTPDGHTIRWSAVPGASRYHVRMDGKGWKDFIGVVQTAVPVTKGKWHKWDVAAYDSHGRLSTNYSTAVTL